jgi:hypothetical protein
MFTGETYMKGGEMLARRTIFWATIALVAGVAIGFGSRGPIASVLNLNALQSDFPDFRTVCPAPKIWTGNGCADPRTWTLKDWLFFQNCLANAMESPPPPLPDKGITSGEYAACAGATEGGKGR